MSYTEAVLRLLWMILVEIPVWIAILMTEGFFALIAILVCCMVLDFQTAASARIGLYESAADAVRSGLRHVRRRFNAVVNHGWIQ